MSDLLAVAYQSACDNVVPSFSRSSTPALSGRATDSGTFSQYQINVMKGMRKNGHTYASIASWANKSVASVIEAVRDSPARLALGESSAPQPVSSSPPPAPTVSSQPDRKPNVFVAGSLAVDLACDFNPKTASPLQSPELKTSNPAKIAQSLGGVGHNVARAAHLMGATVRLCSAIGDDLTGKAALEALCAAKMSTKGISVLPTESGSRTAQYIAVNDTNKDLVVAMADMSILETPSDSSSTLTETFHNFWLPQLESARPSHVVLDGNWSPEYLSLWLQAANKIHAHITFEPVSNIKSTGIFHLPSSPSPTSSSSSSSSPSYKLGTFPHNSIHLTTPNAYELNAMYTSGRESGLFSTPHWWSIIDALGIPHSGARAQLTFATSKRLVDEGIPQQSIQLLPYIPTVCCKLGSEGVLLTQILPAGDERLNHPEYAPHILARCTNGTEDSVGVGGVYMRLFPAVEEVEGEHVVSVNGVGDTFVGTIVAGLAAQKRDDGTAAGRVEDFIDIAQRAAVLTLKSKESVSPGLGTLRMLL